MVLLSVDLVIICWYFITLSNEKYLIIVMLHSVNIVDIAPNVVYYDNNDKSMLV